MCVTRDKSYNPVFLLRFNPQIGSIFLCTGSRLDGFVGEEYREWTRNMIWIFFFDLLVELVLNVLLLYGAVEKKPSFLLPWLVAEMVNIIIFGILLLIFYIYVAPLFRLLWGLSLSLVLGALWASNFYFW
jgi:hypothetical protein